MVLRTIELQSIYSNYLQNNVFFSYSASIDLKFSRMEVLAVLIITLTVSMHFVKGSAAKR